ncbi:MAG: hypothetical protein JWO74_2115 [Solirubrobacterales bacterium]|nr:hypothetical protein [Solirubrobacterales bacterium]
MEASAKLSRKLTRNEFAAMAGGVLVGIGVFLNWYETNAGNRAANVNGMKGAFSAWDVHPILRWLLLAAAVAPFILAYIIVRGHQLSWARGEMTAVTAIAAFGLIVYNGVIGRPGEPSSEISLQPGWWVALLGTLLMLGGAALRSSEVERTRKPPGVI